MFTSEELENFDIFPKEYSFSCLFKFIFYSLSTIFSFLLLYTFYTDNDIYSVITMKNVANQDIIFNDYLTNKLIELSPKDYISENKISFVKSYKELNNNFIKEYVMNSYPCLIKNSSHYFGVKELINLTENTLIENKKIRLIFEYKENPYSQFYDDDYQYLRTTYDNFVNAVIKNNSKNYYFLNEYNIRYAIPKILNIVYDKYLKNNNLVKDLDLIELYFSRAENFVMVWGHSEILDEFVCLEQGSLEYILIPPQEKKYMYTFSKKGPINYSRVNFFDSKNNIAENYPDFLKSNKIYIKLQDRECLYIPAFWFRSYRTNKKAKEKTTFLSFKYYSNSKYLENILYIKNEF